jgi:type IV secretory pathway TrbD component
MARTDLEVPVYRSLVNRMLFAGLPRQAGLVLWTTTFSVGLGLQEIWFFIFGVCAHAVCLLVVRSDPYFFEIFARAMKTPRRLEP